MQITITMVNNIVFYLFQLFCIVSFNTGSFTQWHTDWASLSVNSTVLSLTRQHAETHPWLGYTLSWPPLTILVSCSLLWICSVLEGHWTAEQGRDTWITGGWRQEGRKAKIGSSVRGWEYSEKESRSRGPEFKTEQREQVSESEALIMWIGSPGVMTQNSTREPPCPLIWRSLSHLVCLPEAVHENLPSLSHKLLSY